MTHGCLIPRDLANFRVLGQVASRGLRPFWSVGATPAPPHLHAWAALVLKRTLLPPTHRTRGEMRFIPHSPAEFVANTASLFYHIRRWRREFFKLD